MKHSVTFLLFSILVAACGRQSDSELSEYTLTLPSSGTQYLLFGEREAKRIKLGKCKKDRLPSRANCAEIVANATEDDLRSYLMEFAVDGKYQEVLNSAKDHVVYLEKLYQDATVATTVPNHQRQDLEQKMPEIQSSLEKYVDRIKFIDQNIIVIQNVFEKIYSDLNLSIDFSVMAPDFIQMEGRKFKLLTDHFARMLIIQKMDGDFSLRSEVQEFRKKKE